MSLNTIQSEPKDSQDYNRGAHLLCIKMVLHIKITYKMFFYNLGSEASGKIRQENAFLSSQPRCKRFYRALKVVNGFVPISMHNEFRPAEFTQRTKL